MVGVQRNGLGRVAVVAFVWASAAASGTTLRVPSAQYPTIQAAVNASGSGPGPFEILLAPGEYEQRADVGNFGALFTIRGDGPAGSVVWRPPLGQQTALSITSGAITVDSITFSGPTSGMPLQDAVVRAVGNAAAPLFRDCEFINISARNGAAYVREAAAFFERCRFSDNRGVAAVGGPLDVGAALQVDFIGTVDLLDCTFENNRAAEGGAVAVYNGGSLFARDCMFRGNIAGSEPPGTGGPFDGGAVSVGPQRRGGSIPTATFIGCDFIDNQAGRILEATVPIPQRETSGGGALANFRGGRVRAIECTFVNNGADEGGAVLGAVELDRCLLRGNIAELGGAVAGAAIFLDCTVEENLAVSAGAWRLRPQSIVLQDPPTPPRADRTLFRRNAATQSVGVMSLQVPGRSRFVVTDSCVFEENQAGFIAGVASGDDGMVWVAQNCLITRNRVVSMGSGAVSLGISADFIHCTIVGNFANPNVNTPNAGGPIMTSGRFNFRNSVVAGNFPDFISGILTAEHTVFGPTLLPDNIAGPGVQYRDPVFAAQPSAGPDNMLGTFDDVAGDLRPGDGSPLVDAGDVSALTFSINADVSGEPRRVDDPGVTDTGPGPAPHADLGAFERLEASTSDPYAFCPADYNADGSPGDIFDLFDFLTDLEAGLDFNADTSAGDIFDLFDFLAVLDAGCP